MMISGYKLKTEDGDGWGGYTISQSQKIIQEAPLSLIKSGYYVYANGSKTDRGSYGAFLTRSTLDNTDAGYLTFWGSTRLIVISGVTKNMGGVIRCIKK